jgi:hypothetical protein
MTLCRPGASYSWKRSGGGLVSKSTRALIRGWHSWPPAVLGAY